jgi:hypothetical protein
MTPVVCTISQKGCQKDKWELSHDFKSNHIFTSEESGPNGNRLSKAVIIKTKTGEIHKMDRHEPVQCFTSFHIVSVSPTKSKLAYNTQYS